MGYRLSISDPENGFKFYGTKLYGYTDERKLESYKYLESIGKVDDLTTFSGGIDNEMTLTPEQFREFIRLYKIDFFISIFLVCILFSYYIYAEYDKNKNEAISKEILSNLTFEDNVIDDTTIKFQNNSIIVILNKEDPFSVTYSEPAEDVPEDLEPEYNWQQTENGTLYYGVAFLSQCFLP